MKHKPVISIVMPNYKSNMFEKALKSVFKQTYKHIELIVIDGGSGLKTTKILKKYNKKIDFWISKKDKGMWDAWNKGLKLAKGDYVGIVDSSNLLYPKAMEILSRYIKKYPNVDFICGTVKKDGKILAGFNPNKIHQKFDIIPSSVVGFYIKTKLLKKVGYFNLKYKIQSDYDFLYRIIVKHKLRGIHTKSSEVFGNLGVSGYSKKHSYFKRLFSEIMIRYDNGQNILYLIYIIFGRTFTKIFKL